MNEETKDEWYRDFSNVCKLARWMVEERGYRAREIVSYFEKSWNWSDEWNEMLAEEKEEVTLR